VGVLVESAPSEKASLPRLPVPSRAARLLLLLLLLLPPWAFGP
jgi:hypothetical protein